MPTIAIGSPGSACATAAAGAAGAVAVVMSEVRRAGDGARERGVGVVEDDGGRQSEAGGLAELVAQLDRGEGVEPGVTERRVGLDPLGAGVAEDGRRVRPHQVQQQRLLLRRAQPGQPVREAAAAVAGRGPHGRPAGDVSGRAAGVGSPGRRRRRCAAAAQVQSGRDEQCLAGAQGRVEEVHALVGGHGGGHRRAGSSGCG